MGRREEPREPTKARRQLRRSELFGPERDYLEIFDDGHSLTEDRFIAIGPIRLGLILVVWTERDEELVRIVSARFATRREQSLYRSYVDETQ